MKLKKSTGSIFEQLFIFPFLSNKKNNNNKKLHINLDFKPKFFHKTHQSANIQSEKQKNACKEEKEHSVINL